MILIDGARYDVFERLLAEGRLPAIQEHIVARGAYRRMTTVFTSTTGPAYVPFLTGCFPGKANLPGIRWFDKTAFAEKPFWNPHRFRSYCGWEGFFMNRDINPNIKTIFDLTENPINIFGPITRGILKNNNRGPLKKAWMIARAHSNGVYEPVDDAAFEVCMKTLDEPSAFRFLALPGVDGISHNTFPHHERVLAAYQRADRGIAAIVKKLKSVEQYDQTVIAICSDHGLSQTHTHFDVPVYMETSLGFKTLFYTNIFRWNPDASAQVSGNGMVHIYFKNGDWRKSCFYEDIIRFPINPVDDFLKHEAVDLVITRMQNGEARVDSRRGTGFIKEENERILYRVEGKDPFGFEVLPPSMSRNEALARTFETNYPDALVQIVQNFHSPRCGDMMLSATIGYDLRFRWENPEHKSSHGSLHREHMMTPFCWSVPITTDHVRTVDVFPSMLKILGKDIPEGVDGVSFV
ncbi:MAG TPA: alkaline phosphatase family protein [bacterium]|nr:alkaline phosphatase family protein [bacterium]HMW35576.1 alkaline phosphatase family protein [bacterium]HMY35054.1 alkaline phosphatase family protein [bacterium]HMZ04948.1 alkaline phosphatase family protein [bacterium]HNB08591.1 alkaline phosphatase family protein [bacterium]